MQALVSWAAALPATLVLALIAWAIASARRNVGLVDIFWPLFFVAALLVYAEAFSPPHLLLLLWAGRLSAYLAWRNWSAEEDRRYAEIRRRNEPFFVGKSLYLVFGLQALLAWLISAPLLYLHDPNAIGVAVVALGIGVETLADWQLARFKADAANHGKVMDRGLWRYTRHPNYFGECCVWWGFWLIGAGAGGAWTIFAPLLMTWLLLRVSGVTLLEKDIAERRPGYREYIQSTNAFFPGPKRQA